MRKISILKIALLMMCFFCISSSFAESESSSVDAMSSSADADSSYTQTPDALTPPPAQPAPAAKPALPTPAAPPAKPAKPATTAKSPVEEYNTSGQVPACFENCAMKNPPACCKKQ